MYGRSRPSLKVFTYFMCVYIYIYCFQWVSKSKVVSPEMHAAWEQVQQVKSLLLDFIDADNDG